MLPVTHLTEPGSHAQVKSSHLVHLPRWVNHTWFTYQGKSLSHLVHLPRWVNHIWFTCPGESITPGSPTKETANHTWFTCTGESITPGSPTKATANHTWLNNPCQSPSHQVHLPRRESIIPGLTKQEFVIPCWIQSARYKNKGLNVFLLCSADQFSLRARCTNWI